MKMQRNYLEQFINDNRADFDTATPNDRIWATIEQSLDVGHREEGLEVFVRQHCNSFDLAIPNVDIWDAIEQSLDAASKSDAIDQFIDKNREAFDTAIPSFRVWSEIDKVLHPQATQRSLKIAPVWRVLRVAASVLILLSAGVMAGIYFTKGQPTQTQTVTSLADISPEYAEMVSYYNEQIDQKVRLVSAQSKDKSVLKDLEAIDQTMKELEAELQNAPKGAEEQIISNLIKSYQIKVEILERVLNYIQQSKENLNSEDDEINI